MDANSTPPLEIHLSGSLPGSFVPIRAPLTIDSDSEFCLSVNDQMCSRTSSFNSSSSIDVSKYGDEHISVHEEDDIFVAYPDEEMVIESCHVEEYSFTRPFVKYPDENYVKESSDFAKSAIFRASVKIPHEESSSAVDEFVGTGVKLGVPVAPLTSDCDSDIDSVESCLWVDSDRIPANGTVQKVAMAPKVRVFNSDEGEDEVDDELQFEGVSSGDDINESNSPMKGSVSVETIEDDEHKVECLNEAAKLLKLHEMRLLWLDEQREGDEDEDDSSFDPQRIDAHIVSDSYNEIEIETINGSEQEVFDCYRNESKKTSENEEEQREGDDTSFDSQRINAQIVSDSDNEIENETINGSAQVVLDCSRNESKKISEKEEETLAKMQPIRAKFLSLVRLLGLSNNDSTVEQLLYRLTLGKQLVIDDNGDDANDESDFNLTILAIGKTGAGKSATINSIFGENKAMTDAFGPGTTTVQEIVGTVDGVLVRVLDTPGLRHCPSEQSYNQRILSSIKRFTRKHTPDVVLYVDRLDMHTRDLNDSHLLRLITSSLGSSVWQNCIIALTHARADEATGGFVFQRCRFIQEQIVQLGGTDQRMSNPVWLVENHPSYKQERSWRTRFLPLCYSAKILHEANSVVESSLISLERCRLFEFSDHLGHIINLDAGFEGLVCSDPADEDGCDQVPPFEPSSKSQDTCKRSGERKKAYFEDYDYRVKLLGKKHWSLVCRLHS